MMERETLLAWTVLLGVLLVAGCGASAVQMHARASIATSAAGRAFGVAVDRGRAISLDRVTRESEPFDRETRANALRAEARRWDPLGSGLDTFRTALRAWVDAIELAHLAGEDEETLSLVGRLAARVVLLYDGLSRIAQGLDLEAPELPVFVRDLAVSLAGGE